jgi:hypothetical protein
MPRRHRRLSHTTVVAYLALFVALGGSAYAAATINSADVVNGSLTGADLRNGTVRSADVKGVTGEDLGPGDPWRLRSPNRRFSVSVNNAGVTLDGPNSSVVVGSTGVDIESAGNTDISAGGTVRVNGAIVQLNGGLIHLNGSCSQVADASKVFNHTHEVTTAPGVTGPGSGPSPGFATVFAC